MIKDNLSARKALKIALAITMVFVVIEILGGLISRSLALMADAGHMLSDAASLGLSLFAFWLSARPRSLRRTFGWYRFEIFAALANGLGLWLVAGIILWEAYKRFHIPPDVKSGPMLLVAAAGLAANFIAGLVLYRTRDRGLNVRAAFLHIVGDALGSFGVLAAGLIIRWTGWMIVDPLVSLLLCGLIFLSSWRLIREAFHILMEGTPEHLNLDEIHVAVLGIPGVVGVHDLHIWTVTSGFIALTVHVAVEDTGEASDILRKIKETLSTKFGVRHSTIQIEPAAGLTCATESCD